MQKIVLKQKIILVFLGLIGGLFFMEIILRLLGFGYNLRYNVDNLTQDNIFNNSYRIFCVGESTTFGIGTKNPLQQGYPKQLEGMLNAYFPNKRFVCIYDQMIGQNSSEILLKLPKFIKKYNPKLIILMVGINNWWNLDKSNILLFNNNSYISNFTLRALIFLDRLRLWKLIKMIRLNMGKYPERWNYYMPENENVDILGYKINKKYKSTWIVARKLLEHDVIDMIKICKTNNIKVILCNYPRGAGYPVKTGKPLDAIYEQFARKFEIPFVDNYNSFENLSNLEDYMADKYCHPNEKGYGLVAENIFDCILKNKLIEEED